MDESVCHTDPDLTLPFHDGTTRHPGMREVPSQLSSLSSPSLELLPFSLSLCLAPLCPFSLIHYSKPSTHWGPLGDTNPSSANINVMYC